MIRVFVKKQSNFPIKTADIKKKLASFFKKSGIVSDAEVSVALVGKQKMLDIGKKYLKDNEVHNVLSFTPDESINSLSGGKFVYPPEAKIYLGEIVLCYPKVVEEANSEGIRTDVKIMELIEHGAMHLMGIHHE